MSLSSRVACSVAERGSLVQILSALSPSLSLSPLLGLELRMEKQYGWGAVTDGLRKGPWTSQEDQLLIEHVKRHGEGKWNSVSCLTGLKRCGKSCRLRWVNYLRPGLKRSKITPHEETIIRQLHAQWGNRWSTIAKSLPGRTDNEIKNYWRTHFKKEKPAKRVEQARAKFLRQKALLQQKQQQRLQHQVEEILFAQEMREMACLYSTPFQEEGFLAGGSMTGSEEISNGEDECYATWANLWDLDDVELTWGDEAYFVH